MPDKKTSQLANLIAKAVENCQRHDEPLTLEGIGTIMPERHGHRQFLPDDTPRVFIAYVVEDLPWALNLYTELTAAGFSPWMDRRKLLAGQNWPRSIDHAIETSDFFIACFSKTSVSKRGQFPYELRYALRCWERMPLDDNFLVPVRFEACTVPRRIASQSQYVDLFPDWTTGIDQLIASIAEEWEARRGRPRAA